ncbi:16S rRNA (cytosine1402-N4)-methyltransferase [Ruminococcaceae bacterium YRB3002]|nr:16S rRNA (cytosine1402-N4)-methyltransferase [Ruminococcaceae bacterium YRB3002]
MSQVFEHIPVLFDECMSGLNIKPDGCYIDCTAGGGGHSSGIAARLGEGGRLISIDKDDEALQACGEKIRNFPDRNWRTVKSDFADIKRVAEDLNLEGVDGILADLGVSSHQIDTPERGFSYAADGPLDMRMDRTRDLTAAKVVNTYTEEQLADIFYRYGEEKFSRRIAAGIVRDRIKEPFNDTLTLANKIASYMPGKGRGEDQHPARRCFQALRIEVNGELEGLERMLDDSVELLNEGGRIAVITFHSLEDRIVKEKFRTWENPCTCPKDFPYCVCGNVPKGRVITKKPVVASDEEIKTNRRAHSCKLRIFERGAK